MKKNLFYAMAAIALLASCSSEDNEITNENEQVAVVLGTGAPTATLSRASIDNNVDGNNNWIGSYVGVLGLAKNETYKWDNTTDANIRFIDNFKASISGTKGEATQTISFAPTVFYYPLNNDYQYTFYAYLPYADALTYSANQVSCSININGSQDIMHAKSVAPIHDGYEGYCAKYIRKGGSNPSMEFTHKLTKFTFSILAAGENEEEIAKAKKLKVNYIKILKVPSTATLTIADRNTPVNEGTLAFGAFTSEYQLKDKNGINALGTNPNEPATKMGESILVPAGKDEYTIQLEIEDETGRTKPATLPIVKPAGAVSKSFVAGESHNVKVTIYGLKKVQISTTLVDWVAGEEIELPDIN